jgi:hypothetical protein
MSKQLGTFDATQLKTVIGSERLIGNPSNHTEIPIFRNPEIPETRGFRKK